MVEERRVSSLEHPLALGSFRSWIRLIRESEEIDRAYLARLLFVSMFTLLTSPLRLYERQRYGRAVENTRIHPSPVFIVGHWRTGTTHLHNLICMDHQFGYLSTFQAMAPGFCLVGDRAIKPLLARIARKNHPTREIDNIPLSFDAPQEEDFAIANMSPYSFLHLYTFPRQAPYFFERYALFEDLPESTLTEWTEIYLTLLRKATFSAGGKRLVLKNPANTGRIGTLLELFPDARFIHIYRNPYNVFRSMLHVYMTVLPRAQLQDIGRDRIEGYILTFYSRLMKKFLADKALISTDNLVEVKFEDLEEDPLGQLQRVYDGLRLPGFDKAAPTVRAYMRSIEGYQKNPYEIDDDVVKSVNRHWRFAFEEWGYVPREALQSS